MIRLTGPFKTHLQIAPLIEISKSKPHPHLAVEPPKNTKSRVSSISAFAFSAVFFTLQGMFIGKHLKEDDSLETPRQGVPAVDELRVENFSFEIHKNIERLKSLEQLEDILKAFLTNVQEAKETHKRFDAVSAAQIQAHESPVKNPTVQEIFQQAKKEIFPFTANEVHREICKVKSFL